MFACRSLFHVARATRLTRHPVPCAAGSPLRYIHQGSVGQNKLASSVTAGAQGPSNNAAKHKNRKSSVQRWRPISTGANPNKENVNEISTSGGKQAIENSITARENLASAGTTNVVIEVTNSGVSSSENNLSFESSSTKVVIEDDVEVSGFNKDLDGSDVSEKYSSSIGVDAPLICFVKGKGGSMQKQIEEDTGVKIIFPSSKEDTSIVLEGKSAESIRKASEKIANVIEEAVQNRMLVYSHLISLPLAIHTDLVNKLKHFQNSILGASASYEYNFGIDKSIFTNPKEFHLTVLMLKLRNKDRVAKASDVLQSISSQVNEALENRPISIQLRGLRCMKGSLTRAQVVYAPVVEVGGEGRLVRACKIIIDAFVKSGLVCERDARKKLKLHATIMNASHRKMGKRRNDSFDARNIFRKYGTEEWGEYPIRDVHLSHKLKFDKSGYFRCCSSIPLPC